MTRKIKPQECNDRIQNIKSWLKKSPGLKIRTRIVQKSQKTKLLLASFYEFKAWTFCCPKIVITFFDVSQKIFPSCKQHLKLCVREFSFLQEQFGQNFCFAIAHSPFLSWWCSTLHSGQKVGKNQKMNDHVKNQVLKVIDNMEKFERYFEKYNKTF